MKKTYKLRIFSVVVAMLFSVGLMAQITPTVDQTTITSVTNYVELQTGSGDNWSGSATAIAGYTNYFTVSGSPSLTTYDGTAANPAAAYVDNGATAITHVVPTIVIPDQNLNPGTFTYAGGLVYGSITDNSIWTWDISAATTATLTDVSDALPAGFTAGGGALRDAAHFNQRYLSTGTTVETFNIGVHESSVNAAGSATLCDDADEAIQISVVAFPSAALNAAGDAQGCWNSDATTYDLVIDLVGTPPFLLGLDYTIAEDGGATTYEFVEIETNAGAGADQNVALGTGGAGVNNIIGTLAGAGLAWTYTITFEQDPGTDGVAATSNEINLSNGHKTTHSVTLWQLNDHYSRKSDRNGAAVNAPDAWADRLLHCWYTVPTGVDMAVELYPVPNTGNIFTLPN